MEALFKGAGGIQNGNTSGFAAAHPDLECVFVRAQDVPGYVESGALDCGLTGRDWILEGSRQIVSVAQMVCSTLNFGRTRWVLAVPHNSDCRAPEDLAGRVVTTEIVKTTTDYFARRRIPVRVEFSWGPVEMHLPVLADAIVGSIDSGAFHHVGQLRVLETVLESATELISSPRTWADPPKRKMIENLALMLYGKLHAQLCVGLMFTVRRSDLEAVLRILPADQKASIAFLHDEAWVTVNTVIEESAAWRIVPELKAVKAENIVEFPLNRVLL